MQNSKTRSQRLNAAVLVFIVGCLLSSVRIIVNPARGADEVSKLSDERFAALKFQLPDHGVIGYVGESGERATPDYYLAQYALAPLVLDHSPDHALVVGNFPSATPENLPTGLQLVKDFGHGVLLLHHEDSQ